MKFLALIGLIVILFSVNLAGAAPTPVCLNNQSISGFDLIPNDNSTNYLALSGLLITAVILLTIMIMVSGVLWALSGVLELPMLKEYSRRELGQVALTGILVLIILGSFSAINFAASKVLPFSNGIVTSATYNSDCASLSGGFSKALDVAISLVEYDDIAKFLGSFTFYVEPGYFGYVSNPYMGALLGSTMISLMITLTGGVAVLYLVVEVILTLVYVIMPLFLFVGIVLRCLPWTRAAGGAFIAMFIGFFIIFPILVSIFIQQAPASYRSFSMPNAAIGILSSSISATNLLSLITNSTTESSVFDGYYAVAHVSSSLISPALFIILGTILSLIIAFDFTDTLGGLLGSPSLSSGGSFGKLL